MPALARGMPGKPGYIFRAASAPRAESRAIAPSKREENNKGDYSMTRVGVPLLDASDFSCQPPLGGARLSGARKQFSD